MPVIVSKVLIVLPRFVGLGGIVGGSAGGAPFGNLGAQYRRSLLEIKRYIALEMNGVASIGAGRKSDRAPTGGAGRCDGLVDGGRIDGGAIALRAINLHIETTVRAHVGHGHGLRMSAG